ncbi:tRNA pseudouridine(55) synthase TruB [Oceanispirochaeta sp.]|jgi:tRNA pseudouridine55 synthase|uniref:tRNA pseudouridine(55) synthase TruB n=1 Tax=Oceanispirochaeta sp. TaxID=2035350 RepID=UPI00261B3693|nr:tRNA pseudouridine(55) synthase TruB [Oceanispirochaeta sp.]MDA3959000.1 tRNA pseudouridine(55) synthase TruB [Oceanispirochaeta sp.]
MKNQKKQNPDKLSYPDNTGGGIVFLHKMPGLTSFQALGQLKRVLGTRKVGHTGTLDKFAEGLLIILTGKLTRLNSIITAMDKEYVATIRFGTETDTLDPEGETVATADPPSLEIIESKLDGFRGELSQTPPQYSAIHIDGKRAHSLARKGQLVEMPSRKIFIYDLELLEYNAPDLKLRVHCSKGTYIRSLARDLGLACESRAFVQELVRTSVGPFKLENAVVVDDFRGIKDYFSWEDFFLTLGNASLAVLNEDGLEKLKHGVPFNEGFLTTSLEEESEFILLKDKEGSLKAVLEMKDGHYQYKINLAP